MSNKATSYLSMQVIKLQTDIKNDIKDFVLNINSRSFPGLRDTIPERSPELYIIGLPKDNLITHKAELTEIKLFENSIHPYW